MKLAAYARVSTTDKDQNPETQLIAIRDYAGRNGHTIYQEYVDFAPARDYNRRKNWIRMIDDHRHYNAVIVFKGDRAFRSPRFMELTLHAWEMMNIGFIETNGIFDCTSPQGRMMNGILAYFAEYELEMIKERTIAGMDRARREGKQIGRPEKTVDLNLLETMIEDERSISAMAKELNVSRGTVRKELSKREGSNSHDFYSQKSTENSLS